MRLAQSVAEVACLLGCYTAALTNMRPAGCIQPSVAWIVSVIQFNKHNKIEFYVVLTVHPGTSLSKGPTCCTITLYNIFIIIILYMFRATLCSSLEG